MLLDNTMEGYIKIIVTERYYFIVPKLASQKHDIVTIGIPLSYLSSICTEKIYSATAQPANPNNEL